MSGHIMLRIFTFLIVCCMHTHVWCMDVTITTTPVSCNGGYDGILTVKTGEIIIPTEFRLLTAKKNQLIKTYSVSNNTELTFTDLAANDYTLQVISNGKVHKYDVTIKQPDPLSGNKVIVEKYPSSKEECDGIIKVTPTGGTEPYQYSWIEGEENNTNSRLTDLCENIYKCKVTDANNCETVEVTAFLFEGFNRTEK